MDVTISTSKDKDKEKEKEKDKDKEKEREREVEMEAALYTNCLLLGLDASVLGQGGMPRSGLFRHSNPRMGETLLHFLLCALRGPTQSAKDFAGVWPIFDAAQSRDFRKIVQNLINELEAQGALPRSNSRVSSLATCCGQRFVELLWQLSAHALREVHKRSFPADILANPLPASLTEIVSQNIHAAALLTVTKARIAIERRRFLEGAVAAVQRQSLWSSLAHDMTAEYRSLCAEEAYLHQELEKLQQLKVLKDNCSEDVQKGSGGSSFDQKSISVARATQLWESLLTHTVRHEKLASGPIEDLIAHREHRYRVSGTALRAACDRGSSITSSDVTEENIHNEGDSLQQSTGIYWPDYPREKSDGTANAYEASRLEETRIRSDERAVKGAAPLDVAEILRRWTHALQRLHKQAFRLARSNDGTGPELMKDSSDHGDNGHAQALRATLAEHRQHLTNIQVLIGQLKEAMPGMEASIATLREQVSRINPLPVSMAPTSSSVLPDRQTIPKEETTHHVAERLFKNVPPQLELVPPTPLLKLPQLFSLSPAMSGRPSHSQRHRALIPHMRSLEVLPEVEVNGQSVLSIIKQDFEGRRDGDLASLRQAVRDAALSGSDVASEIIPERFANGSEHFFTPIISADSFGKSDKDQSDYDSQTHMHITGSSQEYHKFGNKSSKDVSGGMENSSISQSQDSARKGAKVGIVSTKGINFSGHMKKAMPRMAGAMIQESEALTEKIGGDIVRPFSPPLLTELSSFGETYDDLLGTDELCDASLEGVWFNPEVL
eukprot:c27323_g1_i1 orf=563-2899(+)